MLVFGITRLLQNPITASKAYLPGSFKKVNITSSLILLLWSFIDSNKKFLTYLCGTKSVLVVLKAIIFESLEARENQRMTGNLRMATFLLHILSQDRNFGIQLNAPADLSELGPHARVFPPFAAGCWGDVLYLFIYTMISTNNASRIAINHLQESYLSILANCSPLITNFNPITAQKIYALFAVYSSPRYLLAKERNHSKIFYLLYTIDTILQYQYQNVQIVYTFVRHKEKVLALRDLTFESAVELANKVKGAPTISAEPTEPISSLNSPNESARSSVASLPPLGQPSQTPMSEKAKGKLPEGNVTYLSASGFEPTSAWVHAVLNFLVFGMEV